MAKGQTKRNLTTGEIAQLCGVNFRTVIRWIQRGHLNAFKLPGRGDNRVPVEEFIRFLRKHAMPIPPELRGDARTVLLLGFGGNEVEAASEVLGGGGFDVICAETCFAAGVQVGKGQPCAAVVDAQSFTDGEIAPVLTSLGEAGLGLVVVGGSATLDLPDAGDVVSFKPPVDWTMVPAVLDDILAH